jgi:tetratricopeptide (TPR) repeat protein
MRLRPSLRPVAGALLCVLLAMPGRAHAQLTPAQKQEVRDHYDKAARAYAVQKFGEAVEEYQKTYEISGDPAMLFNVAQAYRLNGQPQEAVFYYRRYLERSPLAPNRADVEQKIADLEKTLETTRKAAPETAATTSSPPPTAPPPTTPPAAAAAPLSPNPTAVAPGTTGATPVPTAPPPLATTPTFPSPHVVTVAPEGTRNVKRTAAFALLSVGAAGLLTAAITGKLAENRADNLTYASSVKGTFDPGTERSGKQLDNVAVGAVVIGTGAALAGVVLLLLSRHPSTETTSAAPAANHLPSVAPILAGGTVGATAALAF